MTPAAAMPDSTTAVMITPRGSPGETGSVAVGAAGADASGDAAARADADAAPEPVVGLGPALADGLAAAVGDADVDVAVSDAGRVAPPGPLDVPESAADVVWPGGTACVVAGGGACVVGGAGGAWGNCPAVGGSNGYSPVP